MLIESPRVTLASSQAKLYHPFTRSRYSIVSCNSGGRQGHKFMPVMAKRVAGFGTTIFSEINSLARKHNAVNLGQGAPDFDSPPEVLSAAGNATNSQMNQYAPGGGSPHVREASALHAARFYE